MEVLAGVLYHASTALPCAPHTIVSGSVSAVTKKAPTGTTSKLPKGSSHVSSDKCMHLIMHLPQGVMQLGLLWAVSMFPFENANGALLRLVTAAKSVPLQVAEWWVMKQAPIFEYFGTGSIQYLHKCIVPTNEDNLVLFSYNKLECICVFIELEHESYLCDILNFNEKE